MIIKPSNASQLERRTFMCGECFAFAEMAHEQFNLPLVLFGNMFDDEQGFVEEGDWSYPYDFEACHVAIQVSENLFIDARGLFTIDEEDLGDWMFSSPSTKDSLAVVNIGMNIELARSFLGGIEDTPETLKTDIQRILHKMDISIPASMVINPIPVKQINLTNNNYGSEFCVDQDLLTDPQLNSVTQDMELAS